MKRLPQSFFNDRDTLELAKALLGKVFVYKQQDGSVLSGIIAETEAYTQEDEACHTSRGKTPRNAVMFEKPGTLYVYFTYGMHYCSNIVAEPSGRGCAVLIRAVKPLEGKHTMARRRKMSVENNALTDGPAKFTQAFGIAKAHNGTDLCKKGGTLYVADAGYFPLAITSTPRIGIRKAVKKPWRFVATDFSTAP